MTPRKPLAAPVIFCGCAIERCCLAGLIIAFVAVPLTKAASPRYTLQLLGLTDTVHTRGDGYQYSKADELTESGFARGVSNRYNGSFPIGESAWLYDGASVVEIGLIGPEHTGPGGSRHNRGRQMNESGQVIGYHSLAIQTESFNAWLYDGTTTIEIGFTGPGYIRDDGYRAIAAIQLNEAGHVLGYSRRYSGSTDMGLTAWLYDGAMTIDIGLTDAEYTRANDGYKSSSASQINEAGQAAGVSSRFSGSTSLGNSAWLYDGTNTVVIGLTGAEHTRSDGYRLSSVGRLNEAGQVYGTSYRFTGSPPYGRSAWFYNGTSTIDIGLTGPEHTKDDGYRNSVPEGLDNAGRIYGYADRYNGGAADLGRSAFYFNGTSTLDIGLTTSNHTRNDGYRTSRVSQLNGAGQARGFSFRYNGATYTGQSAWLFDGTATIEIGLIDAEHTSQSGYRWSESNSLNEAGQLIGYSQHFSGYSLAGSSAWFYNGADTIEIGLSDAQHTNAAGFGNSSTSRLNNAGQVTGGSGRYNGATQAGSTAWMYDSASDQTFPFVLSTRSDGYAYSFARYLGDDGLVLGFYTLFDELDANLGNRAFYFTMADGLHDLGSLVDLDLSVHGWEYLADTVRANELGQILGHGKLTSQSGGQMAYLLKPALPGDFNGDLLVDAADYVLWRKTGAEKQDYQTWRDNFGRSDLGGAAVGTSHAAIPEPTATKHMAILLVALLGRCVTRVPGAGALR